MKIKLFLMLFLLTFEILAVGQTKADSYAECEITFRVLTSRRGSTQNNYVVGEFKDEKGVDHVKSFNGLTGAVPCGRYKFTLRNKSTRTDYRTRDIRETSLLLKDPETWLTLFTDATEMADGRWGNATWGGTDFLIGKVIPAPGPSEMWVQFHEMFGKGYVESKVEATGQFRIPKSLMGRYLVYIVKDAELIHVEQVYMLLPARMTLEVKEQNNSLRYVK